MNEEEVLTHFREAGALLEGHFLLSSGLHSPVYLQCARLLADPRRAERLCAALAAKILSGLEGDIDLVVSPAMGGVVVGYEMARQLNVRGIFAERVNGEFVLRRGFEIPPAARVLMVEDVVTTGLSSRECIACIQTSGGNVVGAAALVDRSGGSVNVGVPLVPLLTLEVPIYTEDALPEALAAIPAEKPGSRDLNTG